MKISDLMTTDVLTVGPQSSLKEVARRMLRAGVSGIPVTSGDGELVGIITEADFVASEADRRAGKRAGLLRFFTDQEEIPAHEQTVGDVMTKDVIVIAPDADHADAARLMERERVKRLPVVDDAGQLVGLVSRADMLRAFIRPDHEIIEEIQDHVMRKILWIDPNRATIECVDGNVVLRGRLETRSDANLLVELTKRLDGVASVADHLDWDVDNTKVEMVSPPVGYPRATQGLRKP
jgi:CBS domain-containing protein